MDLPAILQGRQTRLKTDTIIRWVGNSQPRFDKLFGFVVGQDSRLAQVAAWPLSYCVISNPKLINKHWRRLLDNLNRPGIHNAIRRNTIRLLEHIPIPPEVHGEVMTICFDLISSPSEKPAVKAFSLTVLHKLSDAYPEILVELKTIIHTQWENESPAFRSRAKKILASL